MVEELTHKHKIRSWMGKMMIPKESEQQLIRITQHGPRISYLVKAKDGIGPHEIFQSLNLEQN